MKILGDPQNIVFQDDQVALIHAGARSIPLEDESVQCVCTSPPYWGLRDYGIEPSAWGGDEGCEHEWGAPITDPVHPANRRCAKCKKFGVTHRTTGNNTITVCGGCGYITEGTSETLGVYGGDEKWARGVEHQRKMKTKQVSQGQFCQKCSAWLGVLGLEPTPELYVEHMVEIFREIHRVLRKDGTVWLNLGDSYASIGRSGRKESPGVGAKQRMAPVGRDIKWRAGGGSNFSWALPGGQKPKDLVGTPWRVAFALQADGWWLRSDIIWFKPNPMPESVTDRPTRAHEYIFLLTKSARYFYDADAVREPQTGGSHSKGKKLHPPIEDAGIGHKDWHKHTPDHILPAGRNRRTVWTIATQPYPESHFATFPEKLVEPCVLAGTSPRACQKCGAPWERVVERGHEKAPGGGYGGKTRDADPREKRVGAIGETALNVTTKTIGFQPTCSCPDNDGSGKCIVLDPFVGSGTTVRVAVKHGRIGIGLDIKREYLGELATERISKVEVRLL